MQADKSAQKPVIVAETGPVREFGGRAVRILYDGSGRLGEQPMIVFAVEPGGRDGNGYGRGLVVQVWKTVWNSGRGEFWPAEIEMGVQERPGSMRFDPKFRNGRRGWTVLVDSEAGDGSRGTPYTDLLASEGDPLGKLVAAMAEFDRHAPEEGKAIIRRILAAARAASAAGSRGPLLRTGDGAT